jgi:hypothetical protein
MDAVQAVEVQAEAGCRMADMAGVPLSAAVVEQAVSSSSQECLR